MASLRGGAFLPATLLLALAAAALWLLAAPAPAQEAFLAAAPALRAAAPRTALRAEAAAAPPAQAAAEAPAAPGDDELARTFQRTVSLCDNVEAHLAAAFVGEEAQGRVETVRREIRAERGLGYQATLGSTGGDIAAALQANDLRLARLRAEIAELKQRCDEALPPAPKPLEDAELVDLDELLGECDAIQAQAERWQQLQQTPAGWRRLEPGELQGLQES
mmetsp:Transcript_53851/g.166724  ORF Transcript_53851/g.166724 Transcript_53851/m.166724 type:complete len:220 (-) Transcript_53851:144-803(-)